jgi:hypothetical protein
VALTADKWQRRVLAECGRPLLDPATPPDQFTRELLDALQEWLPDLWAMAGAEAGSGYAPLRCLYATRLGLKQLLGVFYRYVDVRLGRQGVSQSQSQIYKNLLGALDRVEKEIAEAKKDAALSGVAGAGTASAGVLTRTASYVPGVDPVPDGSNGAGLADPSSPLWGGWPGAGRRLRGV